MSLDLFYFLGKVIPGGDEANRNEGRVYAAFSGKGRKARELAQLKGQLPKTCGRLGTVFVSFVGESSLDRYPSVYLI